MCKPLEIQLLKLPLNAPLTIIKLFSSLTQNVLTINSKTSYDDET